MSPSPTRTYDEEGEEILTPHYSHGRNKKFHKIFTTVPEEDRVLDYYSCAFIAEILLQGHLYITEQYFGFYSNVFGHVTKILIPVSNITQITKERTAKIFPNAVGVTTSEGVKYCFGSLLSRYTTYRLMTQVWRKSNHIGENVSIENHKPDLQDATKKQDSEDETISPEPERQEDEPSNETNPSWSSSDRTLKADKIIGDFTKIDQLLLDSRSSPNTSLSSNCASTAILDEIQELSDEERDNSNSTKDYSLVGSKKSYDELKGGVFKSCMQTINMVLCTHKVKDYLSSLRSLPRTYLFLLTCTVLLVFLYMSVIFLIWRMQTMNINRYRYYDTRYTQFSYRDMFKINNQMHTASVRHLRELLSFHIRQLAEIQDSLEALSFLGSEREAAKQGRDITDNAGDSLAR